MTDTGTGGRGYDAIVVGAGAMGSAAAWALARRGAAVLLLERFGPGHRRGSSHGATRIFRLAYDEPDYVRLARLALPLWRDLEEDVGEQLLDLTGAVDHGDAADLRALATTLEATGTAFEMLPPGAAADRWPGLHFDGDVLHHPEAGRIHAERTVAALQRRAAELGADVHHDRPVTALRPTATGVTVDTADGSHRARVAVVAVGAWTAGLLAGQVALPALTVTREQVVHFPARDDETPWPSFIHRGHPHRYGLLSPGEGVKVGEHGTGPAVYPDGRSFDLDPEGTDRLRRYVERWVPGVVPEPGPGTTCLYTNTVSGDFVIDRVGALVVACGFSGHGFKFTPLVGEIAADLAGGATQTVGRLRLGHPRSVPARR